MSRYLKQFRPSQQQLVYFYDDIVNKIHEEYPHYIKYDLWLTSIFYYEWEENPRWFVSVQCYEYDGGRGKKGPLLELDVYLDISNAMCGSDIPIYVEKIEDAGHGFPCISIEIATYNTEKDEFDITVFKE